MPIAYNRPQTLWMDSDTPVTLVIERLGAGTGSEALKNAPGPQVHVTAPLTPTVTAKLTGPTDEVAVEAESAETQLTSEIANTSWLWQVRGKKPGTTTLNLELDANVKIDGRIVPLQVRTYTDTFPVKIKTWIDRIIYDIQEINPIWAFFGFGTPAAILAGLWAMVRRSRSKPG